MERETEKARTKKWKMERKMEETKRGSESESERERERPCQQISSEQNIAYFFLILPFDPS